MFTLTNPWRAASGGVIGFRLIHFENFETTAATSNCLTKLKDCIQQDWQNLSSEEIAEVRQAGLRYSVAAENLFEQVIIPSQNKYDYTTHPFQCWKDDPAMKFKTPEFEVKFLKLHYLVEEVGRTLCSVSHVPGYLFASKWQSDRIRIPIHTHRHSSQDDGLNTMTLSIALNFQKRSGPRPVMRFYHELAEIHAPRIREDLLTNNSFSEIVLDNTVTLFQFSARFVPHTVFFSEDLLLFAVFNGVEVVGMHEANKILCHKVL